MVSQLGGHPTPALGFAIGLERIILLIQDEQKPSEHFNVDVYFITDNDKTSKAAFKLSKKLRENLPNLRLIVHCGGGSIKSQFKKADKSGARIALIMGEQELNKGMIAIKYLRENLPQEEMNEDQLVAFLKEKINP